MPVAIGAMEAGGAYSQTIQEVMQIPHETLMKDSTAYKALRERVHHDGEHARNEAAEEVALVVLAQELAPH